MSDKRQKQRQLFDCALEVTWKDSRTISRTITVQAIDLSDSGIRVESSERIDIHTEVFVRAERYGLTGTTAVRHCSRRGSKYVLGLEFHPDATTSDSSKPETFVDYYELMQISPNAEPESATVDQSESKLSRIWGSRLFGSRGALPSNRIDGADVRRGPRLCYFAAAKFASAASQSTTFQNAAM